MKVIYVSMISILIILLVGCSEDSKKYENLNCNDAAGYDSGISAGEIMAIADDGKRDCDYGYENWTVEISKSIGVLPEKTDCYCKGFYESYDKSVKEKNRD
jgi:hypothetical protein